MSKKKLMSSAATMAGAAPTKPQPMLGIDRNNFVEFGKIFMLSQGGHGFVIVRDKLHQPSPHYPPTPREWGAWMAWRKSHGLSCTFAERKGYYTVPAQWPHDFDAKWEAHRSHDAANRYQNTVEAREKREHQKVMELEQSEGL